MKVLTTAWLQAKTELRVLFTSVGTLVHFGVPVFFVWILSRSGINDGTMPDPVLTGVVYSILASYAVLATYSIIGECYSERLGGNLVRIRTLPNGVRSWMMGKVITQTVYFGAAMVIACLAIMVFFPILGITIPDVALLVLLAVLGVLVFAPYGLVLGMLIRSVGGFMVITLLVMGLYGLTGGFIPTYLMPNWVGWVSLLSPFYWLGYLARALFLDPSAGAQEVLGMLNPVLALAVLAAFGVVGWFVGPRGVQALMRKETISRLTEERKKMRTMSGL